MALNDKLLQLKNNISSFKQNMASALSAKGGSVTSASTFSDMVSSVNTIGGGKMKWFDGLKFSQTISDSQLEGILSGVDFSEVTDFSDLLRDRSSFTTFPAFDTSRATNLNNLFRNCTKLVSLPYFNVENATNIEGMIEGCTSLQNVGGFGGLKENFKFVMNSNLSHDSLMNIFNNLATVSGKQLAIGQNNRDRLSDEEVAIATNKGWNVVVKLPYTSGLFKNDSTTTDEILENVFQGYDTANLTNMNFMFQNCSSITTIPLIDTENATRFDWFCASCTSLIALPQLVTSKVTTVSYMLFNCISLTSISQLDTSNVNNFSDFIKGCTSLIKITQLNTAKNTDMLNAFQDDRSLRYMLLLNLGTQEGINGFMGEIKSTKWGVEDPSIPESAGARQSMIDSMITYSFDRASAGYSPLTYSLSSESKSVLTEEEIAAVTSKGYTIA